MLNRKLSEVQTWAYLTYFYPRGHLYAKHYRSWWKFNKVRTKSCIFFVTRCIYKALQKHTMLSMNSGRAWRTRLTAS